jgi:hypothetical protein
VRARLFEAVGVVLAYTWVAVFATWPLARYPLGGFYGFGNDNWGGIPYLGWLHDAYLGPESAATIDELQAPFGLAFPAHGIQPIDQLFALLFGGFDQGLGAYNAQIFLGFVLSGCTMYLLARYVTGSPLAAFVAGFAYTFSPFHLAFGMQYNALAGLQWIPLYLLALLVLLRTGRLLHAGLAGAAFALVAAGSYYYAWFVTWFTVVVLLVLGLVAIARSRLEVGRAVRLAVTRGAVGVAVIAVLLGPLLITSAQSASEADPETIEHPLNESVRYSARPWMLFLPPHDNPFVPNRVGTWILRHLEQAPVHEQSLYIGYALLFLVGAAFVPRRLSDAGRARFARGLFGIGATVSAVMMIGPYIPLDTDYWRDWSTPEATRHLPSLGFLMHEVSPIFRFFSRAFVLFLACLVVLGAIGFARLERRVGPSFGRRAGLAAIVVAIMGLEYTNAPPHVWFSDRSPPWVEAVKRLPKDATIAQYPNPTGFSPRSLYYMFWQTKHRRNITQPLVDAEANALASSTASLNDPEDGRRLSQAGIDYVVVHTDLPPPSTPPYQPQLPADSMDPKTGSLNPWLKEVARTSDAVLYRVLDSPRAATSGTLATLGVGFGAPEPEGDTTATWLEAPEGEIQVVVAGPRRPLALRLEAASFLEPRRVEVRLGGRRVGSFDLPADTYRSVSFPLGPVPSGYNTVTLVPTPGPQSINEATGTPDFRTVSIRVRGPVDAVPSPDATP